MKDFYKSLHICILCFVTEFVLLTSTGQHKLQQIHVPKPNSWILFATGGAPLTRGYWYCSPTWNAVIAALWSFFFKKSDPLEWHLVFCHASSDNYRMKHLWK